MRAYGMTEKGPVRDMNEDSFAYETVGQCLCMAVADGVGGEACGEIASRIAVDSVIEAFKDSLPFVKEREDLPAYLKTVFNKVNIKILYNCLEHRERIGMCTTLTVAILKGTELTVAHIGDTRSYLLHGSELIKLTEDHNEAEKLVKEGKITESEAKRHPGRNRLFKVLGENQYLNPDIYSYNISYGDLVFLCSDGLYSFMTNEQFKACAGERNNLEGICSKLIKQALEGRSSDNITVMIGRAEPVAGL
ncbi:MAG: serine/threonine-protein phosphatase [Clostridiales bacterium]|jgi:protein phosphatase|nr:serine/threonine-protein phosphatase [Clostridiales bacterium]